MTGKKFQWCWSDSVRKLIMGKIWVSITRLKNRRVETRESPRQRLCVRHPQKKETVARPVPARRHFGTAYINKSNLKLKKESIWIERREKMAGNLAVIEHSNKNSARLREQWEICFARFIPYPTLPPSSDLLPLPPRLRNLSPRGNWISSSSVAFLRLSLSHLLLTVSLNAALLVSSSIPFNTNNRNLACFVPTITRRIWFWIVNSLCLQIVAGGALCDEAAFHVASGVVRLWIPCQGHQDCDR